MRKIDRNQAVLKYYLEHPEMSLREIGQVFAVSATRVHQLVKAEEKRAAAMASSL